MGVWSEHVVPRITDLTLRSKPIGRLRDRALAGAHGEVVEIGFGSGLNIGHYPPEITRVHAIEPSDVARRLAAPRVAASSTRVEFSGLDGQALPVGDESVDAAISTFTLCTIPDIDLALREVRRVLRPGGRFHFLEHGLAPEPKVAAWQNRLDGMQRRMAAGCHLNRPIDVLVSRAGLRLEDVANEYLPGPRPSRPWGYLYIGTARKPA
jgi:SAM-dependent methyltransferase